MTFNFNTKETYLEAVAEWKQAYELASQDCRDARTAFRSANSLASKNPSEAKLWSLLNKFRGQRQDAKYQANLLLEERACMKVEAQRQYKERILVTVQS